MIITYQLRKAIESVLRGSLFTTLVKAIFSTWPTYTDWTPTVTQLGNVVVTITEAKYVKIGQMVHIYANLTVTGSGTGANAIVVGALTNFGSVSGCQGGALILDTGTLAYHAGVIPASGTTIKFYGYAVGDFVGITPNFALAAGDTISFWAYYRWT